MAWRLGRQAGVKAVQQPLMCPLGGQRGQALCRCTEASGEAELSESEDEEGASLLGAQRQAGETMDPQ